MIAQFIRAGLVTRSLRATLGSRVGSSVKVGSDCSIISSKLIGKVYLDEGVKIYKATISGHVEIGRYSNLSGPRIDIISSLNPVSIGSFCSIARGVQIQEYNHKTSSLSTSFLSRRIAPSRGLSLEEIESKGAIRIGHDVWVGMNSIIVSGVNVGTGAVIAAGAIVTKDVPPYSIVAGNPAKIIRYRFQDQKVIDELLASEWWTLPLNEIKELSLSFKQNYHAD